MSIDYHETKVCPVCGENIEMWDGENNENEELHLYWSCWHCGNSGRTIINEHDNDVFICHEID